MDEEELIDLQKSEKVVFIYDGDCHFFSYFAELDELRNGIPAYKFFNGRDILQLLLSPKNKGFNLKNGPILITENQMLYGHQAIKSMDSHMDKCDKLLNVLFKVKRSDKKSKFIYPFLLIIGRFLMAINKKELEPLTAKLIY